MVSEYARRNEILHQLGFKSYKHYLRDPLWAEIRARKLKQDPYCYGCSKPAQQVHHEHYSEAVLLGETLGGLYSICKRCHQYIEITRDGYKRTPQQATAILKRIHRIYNSRPRLRADNRMKVIRKTQLQKRRMKRKR